MGACAFSSDPVDAALHAAGCCRCVLYAASKTLPLSPEEADHLVGLFGFMLRQLDNGLWIVVDDRRGLQTPQGSGMSTAHRSDDLANLVVRARCTDRLAGPLTIADATARLAGMGFTLHPRDHRTYGREWWADSQDLERATGQWGYLKDVISAAQALITADSRRPANQQRMRDLTRQMPPLDLGPQPRQRSPEPPGRALDAPVVPPPPAQQQLALDLDAPVVAAPWKPKRRRA